MRALGSDDQQRRAPALRWLLLLSDCARTGRRARCCRHLGRRRAIRQRREHREQMKAGPQAGPSRVPQVARSGGSGNCFACTSDTPTPRGSHSCCGRPTVADARSLSPCSRSHHDVVPFRKSLEAAGLSVKQVTRRRRLPSADVRLRSTNSLENRRVYGSLRTSVIWWTRR